VNKKGDTAAQKDAKILECEEDCDGSKNTIQAVSNEQTILESLQTLSPQQQQSVLDFINFLQSQNKKIEYPTVEDKPRSCRK